MNKLIIIRKVLNVLYPQLKVIVRYNKNKKFEIIVKNVKKTYVDELTFQVMLFIPGQQDVVMEDFVLSLYDYCPILNKDNCVIKFMDNKNFFK
jgi:hypothetical protein